MSILIQQDKKIWLGPLQEYERLKEECDEIAAIALALLIDLDYKLAAEAIQEMAKLYKEVYQRRHIDFSGAAYNAVGFDKKVKQIISIAINETNELNLKSRLDELLKRSQKPTAIITL